MVCVCCVEDKNHREDDHQDAEDDVYFGDQQSSGGGLNVESLTTVCNIAEGCSTEKKNMYFK